MQYILVDPPTSALPSQIHGYDGRTGLRLTAGTIPAAPCLIAFCEVLTCYARAEQSLSLYDPFRRTCMCTVKHCSACN